MHVAVHDRVSHIHFISFVFFILSFANRTEYPSIHLSVFFSLDSRVRLTDGLTVYEGTPEIFYRGQWLTLCVDTFHVQDTNVICGMILHVEPSDV